MKTTDLISTFVNVSGKAIGGVKEFLEIEVTVRRSCPGNHTMLNGYLSTTDFLIQNGRPWPRDRNRLPRDVDGGRLGYCYMNAFKLADRDPSYVYCEGYAVTVFPLPHAWCVDKDGQVVDPTWVNRGCDYFGVAVRLPFVRTLFKRTGSYCGLFDMPKLNYPILRKPKKAWRHPINDFSTQSRRSSRL